MGSIIHWIKSELVSRFDYVFTNIDARDRQRLIISAITARSLSGVNLFLFTKESGKSNYSDKS